MIPTRDMIEDSMYELPPARQREIEKIMRHAELYRAGPETMSRLFERIDGPFIEYQQAPQFRNLTVHKEFAVPRTHGSPAAKKARIARQKAKRSGSSPASRSTRARPPRVKAGLPPEPARPSDLGQAAAHGNARAAMPGNVNLDSLVARHAEPPRHPFPGLEPQGTDTGRLSSGSLGLGNLNTDLLAARIRYENDVRTAITRHLRTLNESFGR